MLRTLRRLLRQDDSGIAAVEFAIVLPVLVALLFTAIETGRFLLLQLKLAHVANSMADLATRERDLSVTTLTSLFSAAQHIARPFDFAPAGAVIVSGVSENAANTTAISWQQRGGGTLLATSRIGKPGEAPKLPEGFDVGTEQTVVAAEVFFQYKSWLLNVIPDQVMYNVAFYRPRLGTLTTLAGS
jgi:Flp pilus assembly protein TadG